MRRWKIAALHATVGAIAIAAAVFALLRLWYPPALWPLSGASGLWLLFAAVALLPPALTALVYRSGKRSLRFDIGVILLIQVAFAAYAFLMLGRIRPVFLVATQEHLQLVRANEIDPQDLARGRPEDQRLSWTGPRLVGLGVPQGQARAQLVFSEQANTDLTLQPAYYVRFDDVAMALRKHARVLDDLTARTADDRATVEAALHDLGKSAAQVRYVPLTGQRGSAVMLLDARDGRPLQPLALQPAS